MTFENLHQDCEDRLQQHGTLWRHEYFEKHPHLFQKMKYVMTRVASITAITDPVWRLCILAAWLVAGGGIRGAAYLLAGEAFRCAEFLAIAHGPTASGDADVQWCKIWF